MFGKAGEEAEVQRETVARYRREMNFVRLARRPVPVSLALLLLLCLVHLWFWLLGLVGAAPPGEALLLGAKVNSLVLEGAWWRLVSCLFLHGGLLHLAFNAYAVFLLGPWLERFYGARRFVLLYVLSGLGASLASLVFTEGPSVGASGAIFGLLGALMVFAWRSRARLPPKVSRAFGVGLMPWVLINLVVGFLPQLPMDNAAHIGGLVTGALASVLMSSSLAPRPRLVWRVGLECLFGLALLVVAWGLVLMLREVALCSGAGFVQCYAAELVRP